MSLEVESKTLEVKFSSTHPDIKQGQFNDIVTLSKAINSLGGSSEIVENGTKIKIESPNSGKILHISDIKGSIAKTMGLHDADIISALGLKSSTVIKPNTFATLGGLSRLIEKKEGLTSQSNENSISIFADNVLSAINFTNSEANSEGSDLLSMLGLPENNEGPIYSPENNNTTSGLVQPCFSNSITVYDSLGTNHEIQVSFIKFDYNKWGIEISANPDELELDRSDGLLAYGSLDFNGDGILKDLDLVSIGNEQEGSVNIKWANQANDSQISFDFLNQLNGMRQLSNDYAINSFQQDGYEVGSVKRIYIDKYGVITGSFSNGSSRKIYQIPIVTFPNVNGLEVASHNLYSVGKDSGQYKLKIPGKGGAGNVSSQMLESSNVILSERITGIIKTKHAYYASARLMNTANEMLEVVGRMIS